MARITRRLTAVAATVSALSVGLLAAPQPASAATLGSCGSSYSKVGSYPLRADWQYNTGSIDVYYSSSTGKNCAITRPGTALAGKARHVWVCIEQTKGYGRDCDGLGYGENFRYYAGPVSVYGKGQCINVTGGFTRPDGVVFSGMARSVHCG
ncbi:hypothetical protein [Streptomyces zaomyceticus]|uniref:hypothetical protein n=1 Tax=Streptomyces zaomyceticus TaxID=68286 RepID=UPI002F91BF06